jgi:hypothetical protein
MPSRSEPAVGGRSRCEPVEPAVAGQGRLVPEPVPAQPARN